MSHRYTEKGEKVRVAFASGRIIPKPEWERRDWKTRAAIKGESVSLLALFSCMRLIVCFIPDGDFDTSADVVSRATYIPSLLYFHEEILCLLGIKPTVPKHGPVRRDLMMKEIEKASGWTADTGPVDQIQLGLYDKIYLSTWNVIDTVTAPVKRLFRRS